MVKMTSKFVWIGIGLIILGIIMAVIGGYFTYYTINGTDAKPPAPAVPGTSITWWEYVLDIGGSLFILIGLVMAIWGGTR